MNKVPLRQFRSHDTDPLQIEVVPIEDLPTIARKPEPHRQAFYCIFFVTEGSGTHYLDFSGDTIQPNTLHFVGPGQVHYWDIASTMRGVALLFAPSLALEIGEHGLLDHVNFFRTINGVSSLRLTQADAHWVQATLAALRDEYVTHSFGRTASIIALVQLLLVKAQRLAEQIETSPEPVSAEQQLAARYIQLVEQHAIERHKVDWYAAELAVTVGHLSKSIQNALGTTAGALLRTRIVLEAKRLLVHTNDPVATIASQLNFEDPSYFGRFFKREAQQTPRAFRKEFLTKYQN